MEKIAETITVYNYDLYKKMNKFHISKKNKGSRVFIFTCHAIIFIVSILLMTLGQYFKATMYICLSMFSLVIVLSAPNIAAKRAIKSDKILDVLENTTTFYADYFENVNNCRSSRINYEQIYEAYETLDSFYLYMNKKSIFCISKENYTIGNSQKIRDILSGKLKNKFKVME